MAAAPMVDRYSELARIRNRYVKSRSLLERAEKTIPLGSQTFSKSRIGFPTEAAPHFLERGQGSRVWDVDGNEYIDFINALAPVVLGYCDADVDEAVRRQLAKGVSFSLATELEMEVAELLVKHIPCAEKVRFGKNGSDATSAAVRLARAFTGRDRVAVCGYHGWQDWYIGSTLRFKGVPAAVRDLTHTFGYNDLPSLERLFETHPGQFACVVMEPMTLTFPSAGFLRDVQELAKKNGALLIFDEIVTGFRFSMGGAQQLFGVTPDLACFGKSMGNGYPISAVVGRADLMNEMEEIFFSATFGGEALSLAACVATIEKLARLYVPSKLANMGTTLVNNFQMKIEKYGLQDVIGVSGHPSWSILTFKDHPKATLWEIKSLFLQEIIARGVLVAATHNISLAHSDADLEKTAAAQGEALAVVRDGIDSGDIKSFLVGKPIEPLFRVR